MSLKIGIVGMPNVGKSTLFNTLTNNSVPSENFPFCTIDPNTGIVMVKDNRLDELSSITPTQKIVNAYITFVDIAGLVRGASKGEGLGNKFLSHISDMDLILEVVRDFNDKNIIHVEDTVNVERDIDIINTELILKDLEKAEKLIESGKKILKKDSNYSEYMDLFSKVINILDGGNLLIDHIDLNKRESELIREFNFLTYKNFIYLYNSEDYKSYIDKNGNIYMNILFEYELSKMDPISKESFLNDLDIEISGVDILTRYAFDKLELQVFFTVGEKEIRAWVIKKGTNAKDAAGVIHSDFSKNFIKMELVSYKDFIKYQGWSNCKDSGKLKIVGAEHVLEDGDIVLVRHS